MGGRIKGTIKDRKDFERYPWKGIPDTHFRMYSRAFDTLRRNMSAGMKAVGCVGYGVFECVQDLVGYEDLCYLRADDPELYAGLFQKVGGSICASGPAFWTNTVMSTAFAVSVTTWAINRALCCPRRRSVS